MDLLLIFRTISEMRNLAVAFAFRLVFGLSMRLLSLTFGGDVVRVDLYMCVVYRAAMVM